MEKHKKIEIIVLNMLIYLAMGVVLLLLFIITGNIMINGLKDFSIPFLAGISPIILNTLQLVLYSLVISIPLSLAAAIYLVEYAKKGIFTHIIHLCSDILAGTPSIIFGLFGLGFLVKKMQWGFSLYAASATIAILILPTLLRTFEDALKSVPDGYRQAALSLGAGKLRTILTVVIPSARIPLLSGIMLALGRVVGETAALILTMGTAMNLISSPWDSGRSLSVHMYLLTKEGLSMAEAYASAFLLLLIVGLTNFIAYKLTGDNHG